MTVPCSGGKLGCASRGGHLVAGWERGFRASFEKLAALEPVRRRGIEEDGEFHSALQTMCILRLRLRLDVDGYVCLYVCLIFLSFLERPCSARRNTSRGVCGFYCTVLYGAVLPTPELFVLLYPPDVAGQEVNNLNKLTSCGGGNPHRMFRPTNIRTYRTYLTYEQHTQAPSQHETKPFCSPQGNLLECGTRIIN
jgi:hypothetical protein